MDAIMFCADPAMVNIDDAIRHLAGHEELYWEVGFAVARKRFTYPILGFIHINGGQVEYKVTIRDIIPFSPQHYDRAQSADRVKPEPWLQEWERNLNGIRGRPWKTALVLTHIEPFSSDTYSFHKYDGTPITFPPRSYTRVLPPGKTDGSHVSLTPSIYRQPGRRLSAPTGTPYNLAEQNLEEFIIHQLEEIEPGLQLLERQLRTAAGRLDLLCKGGDGRFVVIEIKRAQGTDQVVGQILRYMGWVHEHYNTDKVRGIIIVGKKDQALSYAVKAVPNLEAKQFRISLE